MVDARDAERERIRSATRLLRAAERPVRVLSTLAWPPAVKERFFAARAQELPVVAYRGFDPGPSLEAAAEARRLALGTSAIDRYIRRQARAVESGALMLASVGTRAFFDHSRAIFGAPSDPQPDEKSTALDLALELTSILASAAHVDLGAPPHSSVTAEALAARMRTVVDQTFGNHAPLVELVDGQAANALAGPNRIRIRRDARFTDRDARQLVEHEIHVHVTTSLNGRAQTDLPILAAAHPGTTRTQEGLAVFAEFITGSMALDRLQRLADRVVAIQMAIAGADFLQIYRFFLQKADTEEQAFDNSVRVFRGGVLTGRAPFTKDIVYLDGLLRVYNFLRAMVGCRRSDCLRLLFAGKLDLEDIPALAELADLGLLRPPQFLPAWASDLRFLLAYLAYSSFLNQVDLDKVRAHYEQMVAGAPRVDFAMKDASAGG